ncbi:MAG: ferritin [Candidatus Rokuibacteriota bacterium]
MATSSAGLHERDEELAPSTREMHRAIVSLMEELEAIDWYQPRVDASRDAELREILEHNRDEEKEHTAMELEWIRGRDSAFDRVLRTYLFAEGRILEREASGNEGASPAPPPIVGSLRGRR